MGMSVNRLEKVVVEPNFLKPGFRNIIENHLQILKNTAKNTPAQISSFQEVKYRGDFYGLLNDINVKPEHWWITLRMNGFHSPMDYQGNMIEILVPDTSYLTLLLRRYMNSRNYV